MILAFGFVLVKGNEMTKDQIDTILDLIMDAGLANLDRHDNIMDQQLDHELNSIRTTLWDMLDRIVT